MSTYLIGDIHGCYDELQLLLQKASFDASKDVLWITGDLVSRGPRSLEVLRYIRSLGSSGRIVLGNHDLHLLAVYAGIRRNKKKDCITPLLEAHDADELINWLRHQPLLQMDEDRKLVMTHAGITPQWDIETAKMCAHEVEEMLSSDNYLLFLNTMYGDKPNSWSPSITGLPRLRFITNVLTRMRYCFPNGQLDLMCKDAPNSVLPPLKTWFTIESMVARSYTIIFGHWAALEGKGTPEGIIGLDTGCCWGGALTMLRWEDRHIFIQSSKL